MRALRERLPSPALVIAVIALIVALGGTSYAAFKLPKNSVGTKQLKNSAVTTKKLRKHAVTASKLKLKGLTVPSAGHATSADSATNASHAGSADSATNAANLGGAPASAYEPRPQWALVASDGTIVAQSGGITINAANASSGQYFVDFGTSVANRPASVTLHYGDGGITGDTSATPCGGTAVPGGFDCSFVTGVNDANHLLVRTESNTGGNAPFGFYVSLGS
jgi:hypothetical protein